MNLTSSRFSDWGPAISRRSASVRQFVDDDVPQVARLHQAVFKTGDRTDLGWIDAYHDYFSQVFLDNPLREPTLPSLVYEEEDGRISGFLGVAPVRMSMNERRVQAAVSSQFVVDPASRSSVVAMTLAKAFLEGPQDLSISDEATDVVRKIWEGLGATPALLHSIRWTRPLRPAQLSLSLLRNRKALSPLAMAASPLASALDVLSTGIASSHFHQSVPQASAEELRAETVVACLPEFAGERTLRVDYDDLTFRWLVNRAIRRKHGGHIHKAIVREGQDVIGWYIYHLDDEPVADVLQLAAKPASVDLVLDRLFYEAWRQGAIAVTGRLEPRFLQALSDKYCLFHRRGPWMLVKAKRPELLQAFENGSAFFSRLDGEWSLGFI